MTFIIRLIGVALCAALLYFSSPWSLQPKSPALWLSCVALSLITFGAVIFSVLKLFGARISFPRYYTAIALHSFNTLLLGAVIIALANIYAAPTAAKRDITRDSLYRSNPVTRQYGDILLGSYPDLSEDQVSQLLYETWSELSFEYEAYSQFRERPRQREFVNISAQGFRSNETMPPWPPLATDTVIFMFGGSTLFGYGLPDSQSIPAQVERALREKGVNNARVYNFGRAFYFSSQERVLFESLLAQGFRPNVVVFLDGLNDLQPSAASNNPKFTVEISKMFEARGAPNAVAWGPLAREVFPFLSPVESSFRAMTAPVPTPPTAAPIEDKRVEPKEATSVTADAEILLRALNTYSNQERARAASAVERCMRNLKMVKGSARAFGIGALFAWQPVPMRYYDLSLHPFVGVHFNAHKFSGLGVDLMEQVPASRRPKHFVSLAPVFQSARERMYVDTVHYSKEGARIISDRIVDELFKRKLVK